MRQDVYVWEVPVRLIHWTIFLSLIVLCISGYYIGDPYIVVRGEAYGSYLMGWMRFIHPVVAFVFTYCVLGRIYWAFAGNRWASWRELIPLSRERRQGMPRMLRYYLFLERDPHPAVGHNPLAGISYFFVYLSFLLQILTGFALRSSAYPHGFWPGAFGWVLTLFGTQHVRLVHHLLMYVIVAWVLHHVYSAILVDHEERSGLITSIFTGYKHLERGES
ncbi:MAG TPA: Ni/Fe-hydrogenase, b-type cytochrome subunit [Candidatus Methylomirabilis sp.]|nr:Ni/Fe-hydrogenase, b-type cytochrome subunit [Candidatus Methylomirabilis sp.]HSB77863.1 Ni/Fe-hydrogenase, b-type cytochrome subunit [Candidatus Methylomirabilis sp.]HSC69935.1 Ni/Fe-hydrogenase, b-type cytochrome subunit [Candidatus Methylomirabilis sp.]